MDCKEISQKVYIFKEDGLSSSERDQVEAHLLICEACRQEFANVSYLRKRLAGYFENRVALASPPVGAFDRLQAKLTDTNGYKPGANRSNWLSKCLGTFREGAALLLKRPIAAALIILAVLVVTAFAVPAVRAQIQSAFYGWAGFSIPNTADYLAIQTQWDFAPMNPTIMPRNLILRATMTGGDTSASILGLCFLEDLPQPDGPAIPAPTGDGETNFTPPERYYQPGEPFIVIQQTHFPGDTRLPEGKLVNVRGQMGSLESDAAGQIAWCMTDGIRYTGATRLTWLEDDVKIQIFGMLSDRDLLKIAKSMQQVDISTTEKPPVAPEKP